MATARHLRENGSNFNRSRILQRIMNGEFMDYETFKQEFQPIKNHLNDDAPWDGCLYETSGDEINHVKSVPLNRVWTLVDDGESVVILNGFHFINRIGYIITSKQHTGKKGSLSVLSCE